MSKIKNVRMSWNKNFIPKKIGVLLFETVKNLIFWIVTRVITRDYAVFQNSLVITVQTLQSLFINLIDTSVELVGEEPDVGCTLSHWGPWGQCYSTCGPGIQTRHRSILWTILILRQHILGSFLAHQQTTAWCPKFVNDKWPFSDHF